MRYFFTFQSSLDTRTHVVKMKDTRMHNTICQRLFLSFGVGISYVVHTARESIICLSMPDNINTHTQASKHAWTEGFEGWLVYFFLLCRRMACQTLEFRVTWCVSFRKLWCRKFFILNEWVRSLMIPIREGIIIMGLDHSVCRGSVIYPTKDFYFYYHYGGKMI